MSGKFVFPHRLKEQKIVGIRDTSFRQIVQHNETSLGSNKNIETTQEYLIIGKFGYEKCIFIIII